MTASGIVGESTRRSVLCALGAALSVGCLGVIGEEDDEPVQWTDHPASATVGYSPRLGPPPEGTTAVVVAFEDPSCRSCATFSRETLPDLSRDVDEGRLSYVWRASPGVEPWGGPAARALLAVHDHDPEEFWELKARYYADRDSFDDETVFDRTAEVVEAETSADPDAVLKAMNGGDETIEDHVDRDEAAARESEVESVPGFVLFREDEYVTTVFGAQSYDVFEGALEL